VGKLKMIKINFETRQLITQQAIKELQFSRQYKQGKIENWKLNENLYYGRKVKTEEARANVD